MARKKDEDYLPIPTPEKQLTQSSGWCMTQNHNGCFYQFRHGKCGCKCHEKYQDT